MTVRADTFPAKYATTSKERACQGRKHDTAPRRVACQENVRGERQKSASSFGAKNAGFLSCNSRNFKAQNYTPNHFSGAYTDEKRSESPRKRTFRRRSRTLDFSRYIRASSPRNITAPAMFPLDANFVGIIISISGRVLNTHAHCGRLVFPVTIMTKSVTRNTASPR